jgi:hypothetical protein
MEQNQLNMLNTLLSNNASTSPPVPLNSSNNNTNNNKQFNPFMINQFLPTDMKSLASSSPPSSTSSSSSTSSTNSSFNDATEKTSSLSTQTKMLDQLFQYSNYLKLIENYQKMNGKFPNSSQQNSSSNGASPFLLGQSLLAASMHHQHQLERLTGPNGSGNGSVNDMLGLSTFGNASL